MTKFEKWEEFEKSLKINTQTRKRNKERNGKYTSYN